MSFYTGTQCELLFSLPAAVTKNTYTTAAAFSGAATTPHAVVPAGFFASNPGGVGRALLLKAGGTIATTSAATFLGQLSYSATAGTLASLGTFFPALAPTAAITCMWDLEAIISATAVGGSSGLTLQTNWTFNMSTVASGTTTTTTDVMVNKGQTSTASLSAEVQMFVELFGTWSASAAGNTTTLQQMLLFGLN